MIPVLNLTKEERVSQIFNNMILKESQNLTFSPQYSIIDPIELNSIISQIEDKVYYISDSPSFEYQSKNYTCGQFKLNFIEEAKVIMDTRPDDFFIIYSIQSSPAIYTNPYVPGVSNPKSYMIRGVFIKDPSINREKIINQILDYGKNEKI